MNTSSLANKVNPRWINLQQTTINDLVMRIRRLGTDREKEVRQLEILNIKNQVFWMGVVASKTYAQAMIDAVLLEQVSRRNYAIKAGSAKKPDGLKLFIDRILSEEPTTTERELLLRLEQEDAFSFLDECDHDVDDLRDAKSLRWHKPNGSVKDVPLSALKDRLSRSKRALAKAR